MDLRRLKLAFPDNRSSRTRFFSIRTQLLCGILLPALLIPLLMGGNLIYLSFQTHLQQLRLVQQERSHSAVTTITTYLDDLQTKLSYLARIRGLLDLPLANQTALIEGLTRLNSAYEFIGLVDQTGNLVTSVSPYGELVPQNVGDQLAFSRAFQRGEDFLGAIEIDPTTQLPMLTLAMPIRNQQDRVNGVLLARINLKFLSFVMDQTTVGETGYTYVVDNRLLLIAEKGRSITNSELEDLSTRPFVELIKPGATASLESYTGLRGMPVLGAVAPIKSVQWSVVVELPTAEAYAPTRELLLVLGSGLVVAIILAVGLGFFFSHQITSPLQHLTQAATQFGAGNLDVIVPIKSRNELGVLGTTFNGMAEQLRDSIQKLADYNQTLERTVEQRTAELALATKDAQAAYALAEQANQLKTTFLATMSHELRTPLNVIINFSEIMLSRSYGELGEDQEMLQQRILANGEHLLGLINDILDLSKIESGRMELHHEALNLRVLVEGVMATAVGLTSAKDLKIEVDLPDSGLPSVWADQVRIKQVLLNLISNSAKFTPEGSITIRAIEQAGGWVEVAVCDTGIGIAPEDQQLIFEEFQQLDSDLNRQHKGTGLGLPICKRLIEMHGGQIWVESTIGVGTTFRFTLPVTPGQAALAPALNGLLNAHSATDAAHDTVVVVDDDHDTQVILQHCFEGAGWRVEQVTDSRETLDVVRRIRPQLVVLDIHMPYLDGWTVLAELRHDPEVAAIPVVVCSVVDPATAQVGLVVGVSGWLVKPVREAELLALVQPYSRTAGYILVVDDSADARLVVRSFLQQAGWHVAEAANGDQALALLRKERPVLMILDLMMPVMDGFELLQELRVMPGREDVPVVVLTAKDLDVQERTWLTEQTQYCCQKATFPSIEFPNLIAELMRRGDNNGQFQGSNHSHR